MVDGSPAMLQDCCVSNSDVQKKKLAEVAAYRDCSRGHKEQVQKLYLR
jgi:hypothetical protein